MASACKCIAQGTNAPFNIFLKTKGTSVLSQLYLDVSIREVLNCDLRISVVVDVDQFCRVLNCDLRNCVENVINLRDSVFR